MDELEISGKRYISTRRAAREHGYHSDYMGQLIRGGKVAGQKVGRAWYIDEASLAVYLGQEQKHAGPTLNKEEVNHTEVKPPEPIAQEVPVEIPVPVSAVEIAKEAPAPVVEEIKIQEAPAETVFIKRAPVHIQEEIFVHEKSSRVPIQTPPMAQEVGGLQYTADDSPSIPTVMRMPQARPQPAAPAYAAYAPHPAVRRKFPIVSLLVVAVIAILTATFASNFVSATIVSEPGKSAVVQYAIHW